MTARPLPLAHWDFQNDLFCKNPNFATRIHGVQRIPSTHPRFKYAAHFDGNSHLEIPHHSALNFGNDDFSIALWLETSDCNDLVGDLLSKFDFQERRGWTLNVVTNSGTTTTTQSNFRHLHFGIDQGQEQQGLHFCGRPGQAVFIYALATIEGHLYAGTFEAEPDQAGHLWRYMGGRTMGRPGHTSRRG